MGMSTNFKMNPFVDILVKWDLLEVFECHLRKCPVK